MPTYVYECDQCGTVFEIEQRMTDPPLEQCPEPCGGKVRRLIQAPLILTGQGPARPPSGFS